MQHGSDLKAPQFSQAPSLWRVVLGVSTWRWSNLFWIHQSSSIINHHHHPSRFWWNFLETCQIQIPRGNFLDDSESTVFSPVLEVFRYLKAFFNNLGFKFSAPIIFVWKFIPYSTKQNPGSTIGSLRKPTPWGWFLHTPFPSAEIYRTLPWRQEIIESLLHANLLGFHAARRGENDNVLVSYSDRDWSWIVSGCFRKVLVYKRYLLHFLFENRIGCLPAFFILF